MKDIRGANKMKNPPNYLKVSSDTNCRQLNWDNEEQTFNYETRKITRTELRKEIEPWLTALFQSERLNLLIGSGLTISQEIIARKEHTNFMECMEFDVFRDQIKKSSKKVAEKNNNKSANIEDQMNVANILLEGLNIYAQGGDSNKKELIDKLKQLQKNIGRNLENFINKILSVEKTIFDNKEKTKKYLIPFLMSFSSRTYPRERLHIFTTNYDRVIEWGTDLTGLRLIDRFVGSIDPVFRSSPLNIDMHYNPPGIRGEPRYLEGVAYFTKLHGSLDWSYSYRDRKVKRISVPFGQKEYKLPSEEQCLIYPNLAKDWETANYPYSELFRDFATAICRPNTTLVTYGYGFGDEHINRMIDDMLTIPSTHLVIISYDMSPKICSYFNDQISKKEQISILIGPQLADIKELVKYYLPKSAIDKTMNRMFEIKKQRGLLNPESPSETKKNLEEKYNDNVD